MQSELLPCPFCGGDGFHSQYDGTILVSVFFVHKPTCFFFVKNETHEVLASLIEKWNTRTQIAALQSN